jgi:2Fe-2S ferredoxin
VARVADGTTLLRAALDTGLPLASSCDGAGICRACRVQVLDGEHNLSARTESEHEAAREEGLEGDERYACLARVHGPVTVTTSYW